MFPNAFWHETNLQGMRANAGTAELVRFSPDGIQHYRTGPTSRAPAPANNLSSKHLNSYSLPIRRGGMPDARSGARLLGEAKAYAVASPPAEDAAADRIILVQLTRKASGALPSLTPRHSRSTRVQRLHVPLYSTSI
jgi:hypothetical protein